MLNFEGSNVKNNDTKSKNVLKSQGPYQSSHK